MIPVLSGLLLAIGLSGIARGDLLIGGPELMPRQASWAAFSLLAGGLAAVIPYRWFKPWSLGVYLLCLSLLIAVLFFPPRNGARSWIRLGFADFQPSEVMKLAFVLAFSRLMTREAGYRRWTGLIVPFLAAAVPMLLILREPDLGTSLLFLPMLFAMLFAAGARQRHLVIVGLMGVVVAPIAWKVMSSEQRSRITAVFRQHDGPTKRVGDDELHLHQSKQMLALGGVWGSAFLGDAVADPAAYKLPVARSDFVFCLIGERWGLIGTLTVLGLFSLLIQRGLHAATSTQDPYARLVAVGLSTCLAVQVVINTGMTTGILPITGLPLPLLSYGGSSLLSTAFSLGLLTNIARSPTRTLEGEPFRFRETQAALTTQYS